MQHEKDDSVEGLPKSGTPKFADPAVALPGGRATAARASSLMSKGRWALGAAVALCLAVTLAVVFMDRPQRGSTSTPASAISTPTATVRPAGFPGPGNTGVPEGTALRPYDGPCEIDTPGTTISESDVRCDRLIVRASGVTITRSRIRVVDVDQADASLVMEDSSVDGGSYPGAAVGFADITLRRIDIRGGDSSVNCGTNCLIEDSWLHDQALPERDEHLNGYLSNGGSNVVVRRNTIECTPPDNAHGGGCSGDAQIYADLRALSDYRFEKNLFKATPGGFCTSFGYDPPKKFGKRPRSIHVADNVYERGSGGKCGTYGPATSFVRGDGNVWKNNRWRDGGTLDQP